MTSQATFTRMQDGTLEEWKVIGAAHKEEFKNTADRFIGMLKSLEQHTLGFACDQLQHSLMTGTLARRAGASVEEIVIALCHDIAKAVNVPNHGPIAAEMMRPYISDDSYHVIRNHQAFQGEHYYHYMGAPTDLRKKWVDEPWYDLAVKLVDEWDAPAFDPDFEVDSLESFEPLMRKIFHDNPTAVG
ncbi:HD domain-containing protein [uncultured Parasphingorhabdus sp.]|uniref:HD domain-containing protein n=1 Tax=uncultured Parasphingorhabdus sp. TaxID=2709694 RepID=UPI0030DB1535|tara:strand:- start:269 stop:829 length:561 start_codon:yes stop_codon:yes gene_type:complete